MKINNNRLPITNCCVRGADGFNEMQNPHFAPKAAKRRAFTLIEVMMAVAILSLVATASLKLAVMAQNSLRAARDSNSFITEAQKLRAKIVAGELPQSGNDKNFSWKSETKTKEFFDKNFGKLDFDKKDLGIKEDTAFKWRELEITDNTKKKKIKLVLPLAQGE